MPKRWWNALLNLLFPEPITCLLCNQPITLLDGEESPVICTLCSNSATFIHSPICQRCGRGMSSVGESACIDCSHVELPFEYSRSCVAYRGVVKDLILQLKFQSRQEFIAPLADWLYAAWIRYYADCSIDAVVAVPMSSGDERRRGFNQSRRLSEALCARTGLNGIDALVRKDTSGSQTSRNRHQRLKALRGAFALSQAVDESGGIVGRRLLLVDDVYTTGSTVCACAQVLLAGGASSVHVITVAR